MGNDLSAPYLSLTGQVELRSMRFKMKERPETVTYSFYDAKKAAFLPNHTGANLMAFHPDFTYIAKLRVWVAPELKKVKWLLHLVDAALHPDIHPWDIVHFEDDVPEVGIAAGIFDPAKVEPYAFKTLTTILTPDKNGNVVHKFGELKWTDGYQIPIHHMLWVYAVDDKNRVHAMLSNQRIVSYDVKPGAFLLDAKQLDNLEGGMKVRGIRPASERPKLSQRLSALKGSLTRTESAGKDSSHTSTGSISPQPLTPPSWDQTSQGSDHDLTLSREGSRVKVEPTAEVLRYICLVQGGVIAVLLAVVVYQYFVIVTLREGNQWGGR